MAGGLDWQLKLGDGFSGPANTAKQAADGLSKAFEALVGAGFNAAERAKAGAAAAAAEGEALKKQVADVNAAVAAHQKLAAAYDKAWGAAKRASSAVHQGGIGGARLDNLMAMQNKGTGIDLGASVSKSFGGFTKLVQTVGKTFGQGAANAVMSLGKSFASAADAASAAAPYLEAAASGIAAIGAAALAAGAALLGAAYKGATIVMDAERFKDDALDGFKAIVGTDEEAQKVWEVASKTSLDIAGDLKETMAQMNTLLSQGFSTDVADQIVRAMADVKAMDPKADVEGIADAFAKIQSQGQLTEKTLKSVALATHVTTDSIAEALAQDLGKKKAEIELMLKKGQITAAQGEKAILEALQKKTGKGLGEGAKEANDDVYGMISRLKNLKDQMLANINVDWGPLKNSLDAAFKALSGPEGQKLMDTIGRDLSKVTKALFGDLQDPAQFEAAMRKVEKAIDKFSDACVGAIAVLKPFLALMGEEDATEQSAQKFNVWSTVLGSLGKGLIQGNPFTAALLYMYEALAKIGDVVNNGLNFDFLDKAMTIGSSIIDGIVKGIESGASAVVSSITSVADGAIDAARDSLGIASPSKVFAEIGMHTVAGFSQGVEKESPKAQAAAYDMIEPRSVERGVSNVRNISTARSFSPNVTIHANGTDSGGLGRMMEDTLKSLNHTFA